jgi:hypothetical protein
MGSRPPRENENVVHRAKGQRHSRPIEETYGGVRPYGDVIWELGHLERLAIILPIPSVNCAGKPDAG